MTNDGQHGLVLPEGAATATSRDDRAAAWTQLANGLGARLDALLASEVWGRDLPERPAAPVTHGVYLFSEPGRHLYVGRTGRTERSVRAGKKSASGFRARLAGHCRPSCGLSSATFAIRLALEAAAQRVSWLRHAGASFSTITNSRHCSSPRRSELRRWSSEPSISRTIENARYSRSMPLSCLRLHTTRLRRVDPGSPA